MEFSTQNLHALSQLKTLQKLSVRLWCVKVGDICNTIAQLPNLLEFNNHRVGLSVPTVTFLGQCEKLQRVSLEWKSLDESTLDTLPICRNISTISLRALKSPQVALKIVQMCPALEQFTGRGFQDHSLHILARSCPNITTLDLDDVRISQFGLQSLNSCGQLISLSLRGRVCITDTTELNGLSRLNKLALMGEIIITDESMSAMITNMRDIETLEMLKPSISTQLAHLISQSCPKLTRLVIGEKCPDAILVLVKHCPRLNYLSLRGHPHMPVLPDDCRLPQTSRHVLVLHCRRLAVRDVKPMDMESCRIVFQ